jgi:hypothetical protein
MYTQRPDATNAATMRVVMSAQFYKYDRQMHQVFMPDGTVCNYVSAGVDTNGNAIFVLKSFEDLFGNQVELLDPEADPEQAGWTLTTVRQHLDHQNIAYRDVVLRKDAEGRVRRMTFGDRVWEYTYGFEQDSVLADITHVAEPAGLEWTFSYTADGDKPGDIEEITTPNGGKIHYQCTRFTRSRERRPTSTMLQAE